MSIIITLFSIGLICLVFEVITPGAILGIIGGLFMLAGCGWAWNLYGPMGGVIAFGVGLVLIAITLYVELGIIPKTRYGKRLFLDKAVTGASQPLPGIPENVLGREAEAITVLAPTGYILVDGKKYEAFSIDGYAEKGARLRVTALDNFTLKVIKNNQPITNT